jgi:hypothetical protein
MESWFDELRTTMALLIVSLGMFADLELSAAVRGYNGCGFGATLALKRHPSSFCHMRGTPPA